MQRGSIRKSERICCGAKQHGTRGCWSASCNGEVGRSCCHAPSTRTCKTSSSAATAAAADLRSSHNLPSVVSSVRGNQAPRTWGNRSRFATAAVTTQSPSFRLVARSLRSEMNSFSAAASRASGCGCSRRWKFPLPSCSMTVGAVAAGATVTEAAADPASTRATAAAADG